MAATRQLVSNRIHFVFACVQEGRHCMFYNRLQETKSDLLGHNTCVCHTILVQSISDKLQGVVRGECVCVNVCEQVYLDMGSAVRPP